MADEQISGEVNNSGVNAESEAQPTNENISVENKEPVEQPQEKLLKQSEVNDLVGKVRKEAAEKARRDALLELQKQYDTQSNGYQQQGSVDYSNNPQALLQEAKRQMALEQQQHVNQQVAYDFNDKLQSHSKSNPEFYKIVQELDIGSLPMPIVGILNTVDNIGEVLQDLHERSPEKFFGLVDTIARSPEIGRRRLNNIAADIKANKAASQVKQAPAPLSQIKPSITTTDNGSMTIRDYKKADWLRG